MERHIFVYSFFLLVTICWSQTKIGDDCNSGLGVCKHIKDCDKLRSIIIEFIRSDSVPFCNECDNSVCCPTLKQKSLPSKNDNRLLIRMCQQYNNMVPQTTSPLISAGQKVEPKEFPHMALIGEKVNGMKFNFFCGGTIISTEFILTAAHCFNSLKAEQLMVRLGELDYSTDKDNTKIQQFDVKRIIKHPDFNDKRENDIAVLRLNDTIKFDEYVKPACLGWNSGDELETFVTTGWGKTESHSPSTHLLKLYVGIADEDRCKNIYKENYNQTTKICVAAKGHGTTCGGDSGGPLFVKHPNFFSLFAVFGVTESGLICSNDATPSLFTRVHYYTKWLEEVVWKSV